MFVLIIITVSITPQRYGLNLNYQNFLLFFLLKSAFFLFFAVLGIWSGFIISVCLLACNGFNTDQIKPALIVPFLGDYGGFI